MRPRLSFILLILLSFCVGVPDASAQTPRGRSAAVPVQVTPPPTQTSPAAGTDEEARSLFEAGRIAYEAGRYRDALQHFQHSYDLSHRSALLYNIGSSLDRLRRDAEALAAFEAYLEGQPDSPRRAEVEQRIVILREQVAVSAVAPNHVAESANLDPATGSPLDEPARAHTSIVRKWWFWTVVGVVVVGTAVGIGVATSGGAQGPESVNSGTVILRL